MPGLINVHANVPHGFCQCGCGQKTKLAKQTSKKCGWIKGEPLRFIRSHANRLSTYNSIPDGMKFCSVCKVPKPLGEFRLRSRSKGKRAYECRSCMTEYMNTRYKNEKDDISSKRKEGYQRNRTKILELAERTRLRRFGVTTEWYRQTLEKQEFKCAICGSTKTRNGGQRFSIDHDHDCCPEKRACEKCRRGLLCNQCNLNLGLIENREWFEAVKSYLSRYCKTLTL